jgi:hypothetical protein
VVVSGETLETLSFVVEGSRELLALVRDRLSPRPYPNSLPTNFSNSMLTFVTMSSDPRVKPNPAPTLYSSP